MILSINMATGVVLGIVALAALVYPTLSALFEDSNEVKDNEITKKSPGISGGERNDRAVVSSRVVQDRHQANQPHPRV